MIELEVASLLTTENLALVCTSAVSVTAVLATMHQTKIQKETELAKLYYEHQVEIYSELYEATVNFDTLTPNQEIFNQLLIASQQAKLVSSPETALVIDNFCLFCEQHFHQPDRNTVQVGNAFSKVRTELENALRKELYCYRPKSISAKLRSLFRGL